MYYPDAAWIGGDFCAGISTCSYILSVNFANATVLGDDFCGMTGCLRLVTLDLRKIIEIKGREPEPTYTGFCSSNATNDNNCGATGLNAGTLTVTVPSGAT
jgi:hypothetical protein